MGKHQEMFIITASFTEVESSELGGPGAGKTHGKPYRNDVFLMGKSTFQWWIVMDCHGFFFFSIFEYTDYQLLVMAMDVLIVFCGMWWNSVAMLLLGPCFLRDPFLRQGPLPGVWMLVELESAASDQGDPKRIGGL